MKANAQTILAIVCGIGAFLGMEAFCQERDKNKALKATVLRLKKEAHEQAYLEGFENGANAMKKFYIDKNLFS